MGRIREGLREVDEGLDIGVKGWINECRSEGERMGESTGGLVILREEEPLGWVMWVKVT